MPEDKPRPPAPPGAESPGAGEAESDLGALLETSAGSSLEKTPDLPADASLRDLLEPTALVPEETPPTPAPSAPPAAAAASAPGSQPIRCEFCGTVYEKPPGKFCDQCGRRLARVMSAAMEEPTLTKKCPHCGHQNKLEARICVNCGQLMRLRTL